MKRLFTIAALVVILVLNIPLIKNENIRKIKSMWYNPSTWTAVDNFQNSISDGLGSIGDIAAQTGTVDPGSPTSLSNLSAPDQTPQVLGAVDIAGGPSQQINFGQTTTPTKTAEQLAAEQQAAAQNALWGQLRGEKTTGINNIYGSANDAAINQQGAFGNSVIDNVEALRLGQRGIDRRSQQNEASRMQGNAGILGMIGRGIESGGRYLGNRNAGSSSAGAEIARAYGDMGRRQSSQVGNQFAQNEVGIKDAQDAQNVNTSKTKRDFHQGLMNTVNTIVESARTQLADLDSRMATSTLPDRIAIEQEKQRIKDAVLGHLQQYDSQLATGIDTIHTNTADENRSAAAGQIAAGTAAPNSFQYTDQMPGQFQNTGPFASGLPIFTNPIKKQQIA